MASNPLNRLAIRCEKYGITVAQYQEMFKRQGGACAVCGDPEGKRELAIDHCHETNKVRGLLCTRCNMGLGFFRDKKEILEKAIAYIALHPSSWDEWDFYQLPSEPQYYADDDGDWQ